MRLSNPIPAKGTITVKVVIAVPDLDMDLSDSRTIDIKVYDQAEITNAVYTFDQNVGYKKLIISSSNSCFNNQIAVDNSKYI